MNNVSMSVLLIISSALIGNFVIYGMARRRIPGVFYFCLLMTAMILHGNYTINPTILQHNPPLSD